jgi:hypothetical protein
MTTYTVKELDAEAKSAARLSARKMGYTKATLVKWTLQLTDSGFARLAVDFYVGAEQILVGTTVAI